jgi:hypothetical protein
MKKDDSTFKLLLYRLDKLEEEQRKENQDIVRLLRGIQESQSSINEKIVLHSAELKQVNARLSKLEEDKVNKDEVETKLVSLRNRINVYQKVLMAICGGLGVSLIMEFLKLL